MANYYTHIYEDFWHIQMRYMPFCLVNIWKGLMVDGCRMKMIMMFFQI